MTRQAASLAILLVLVLAAFLPFSPSAASRHFRPRATQAEASTLWGRASRSCQSSAAPGTQTRARVVAVKPILTTAPYSTPFSGVDSFYSFYRKFSETPRGQSVNSDLGWLRTPLKAATAFNDGWGVTYPIFSFMTSRLVRECGLGLSVLNDTQIGAGGLFFSNGSRRFDVAVMGKSEYVTPGELGQYVQFVRSGGRLVLMDSDSFEVEVKLGSCPYQCETFVNGHGWTYGDAMVRSGVWNAFPETDRKLTGSLLPPDYYLTGQSIGAGVVDPGSVIGSRLYQSFGPHVLADYSAFEESRLVNETGTTKLISFDFGIYSYLHRFGLGDVVCLCLEGSKIIATQPVVQEFLALSISTWGPRASGLLVTSILAEGAPHVDTAGGWMQWRSNYAGSLTISATAVALNSEGQVVAIGQGQSQTVLDNQTAVLGFAWSHPLSSVGGIEFRLFVMTSTQVPVSIVILAQPPAHPVG